jgi:hypothetical protein
VGGGACEKEENKDENNTLKLTYRSFKINTETHGWQDLAKNRINSTC